MNRTAPGPTRSELNGLNLLEALSTGGMSQADYDWLLVGATTWLAFGGDLPMQRFLGLPATGAGISKAARNVWIRKSAKLIENDSPFQQATTLAAELDMFISRGPWNSWKSQKYPPEGASELRTALFFLVKFNGGKSLSSRTIFRALT